MIKILCYLLVCFHGIRGQLYPRESESREVKSLDGIWSFALLEDTLEEGCIKKGLSAISSDLHLMPVPASYNDIPTDQKIRDYVGIVGYERSFFVPQSWSKAGRIWVRLESVNYRADVYINGDKVISHEIGHLPFQVEITDNVKCGESNTIFVFCDNTLSADSIPQGGVETDSVGNKLSTYTFDFFNYAGIHRPVKIYTTPINYIRNLDITTQVSEDNSYATIQYSVDVEGKDDVDTSVIITEKDSKLVWSSELLNGNATIENPKLWWPYLMDDNPGYLYNFDVKVVNKTTKDLIDRYVEKIGIRSLTWTNSTFLINNKPVYMTGFGRHEDSDIRGKGLDLALNIRDHNLIRWMGANTYRTSHYPYSEELMHLADELGIMIINECPAVNMDGYSDKQLENHKKSLSELYQRDRNRPSTIMWSIANEPRTQKSESAAYFEAVAKHIKSLDTSRPITLAEMYQPNEDHAAQVVDIIGVNRYESWYSDTGNLDIIQPKLVAEIKAWRKKYGKPILVTEYGADSLEGLHILPSYVWSEEYQLNCLSNTFKAFDELRQEGYFVGELIWNFADFKTNQDIRRVGGNRKGVFTRNRQPKASAHLLRKRYWNLAKYLNNNVTLPSDLSDYVFSNHDEL